MKRKNQEINKIIFLDWDSNFFGFNIGRLYANGLSVEDLENKLTNAKRRNMKFVELFCEASDHKSIFSAEKLNFHLADLRVTMEKKLKINVNDVSLPKGLIFKKAFRKDIAELKKVGLGLFRTSRYYRYYNFNVNKIDQMFQVWIEKSVLGEFDDELYYIKNQADIVAFCSLRYQNKKASLGLFGVNSAYQNMKLGSLILSQIFTLLIKHQFTNLTLITQGKHSDALSLYQKSGFCLSAITLCYYKWWG